jgi:dTDP-4-amino-4,6-dideoxygalactose transaminase
MQHRPCFRAKVSSGTGALGVALSALGVGPGQQVIVPAYMWVSVAAAVVNQGAIPVLADIDDTFCLDPAAVERQITNRTAGIIMVHMSGAPGNVAAMHAVADRHGLFLIEDCAQCCGGSFQQKSWHLWGRGDLQLPDEQEHDIGRRRVRGDKR